MSNLRQVLAIGNTGSQLVSKFNSNFTNTNIRVYNVEDYGAVHDGVTDDTSAIQDAINACFVAKGGVVYLPNGVYLIAGALQTNVGGLNPNSQLYIPDSTLDSADKVCIEILGETFAHNFVCSSIGDLDPVMNGVVLKSTITGANMFSAVFGGIGATANSMNYTDVKISNLVILVNHHNTNGATLSGINFLNIAMSYSKNIFIGVNKKYGSTVKPAVHHFGFATAPVGCNIFIGVDYISCYNFYYGFIFGECVLANNIRANGCYIGFMGLYNYYPSHLISPAIHWCAYALAGQLETIKYAKAAGAFIIENLSIEWNNLTSGKWYDPVGIIYDPDNFLIGEMSYSWSNKGSQDYIVKDNEGVNLLVKNAQLASNFHWQTATRPTNKPLGITGFNTTTNKLETWDGSTWQNHW
jgi:hypothetical protein